MEFQSTLCTSRVTQLILYPVHDPDISIHTLHKQSDRKFNQITSRIFQHFH